MSEFAARLRCWRGAKLLDMATLQSTDSSVLLKASCGRREVRAGKQEDCAAAICCISASFPSFSELRPTLRIRNGCT